MGLLIGNANIFYVSALETHKGPSYIFYVNAMDGHNGHPYITFMRYLTFVFNCKIVRY